MVKTIKNKRVAHIVCTYPPYRGGMGKVALENGKQLLNNGYEVAVFTPRYKYLWNLPKKEIKDNITIYRLTPFLEIGNAAVLPTLFLYLRRYDILHLHYPFYGSLIYIALAKIVWRKKLIVHYHMDNFGVSIKAWVFRFYRYFVLPQMLKLADKIVVHSKDYAFNCYASWWLRHWQGKMVEIPNGVDIDFYHPVYPLAKKIEAAKKRLLFVGSLDQAHHFKGLPVLLNALKISRFKNWRLDVVGNGDLVDYYKELVRQNRLENKVHWHHDCQDDELRRLYSRAYVTILPSTTRGEAFGIVLIESMACQTAVIATALPGVRSVVIDGQNGLLAKPKSIESLRAKIDYMLDHPDEVQEMAICGYKNTKKKYSWQSIGRKLDRLYKSL